jgi:hypothetical protein
VGQVLAHDLAGLDGERAGPAGATPGRRRTGSDAARWWAQDTVGGRASGDTTTHARAVLAGTDDGDPAVLDSLPTCELSGQLADTPTGAELYADAVPPEAPPWVTLDPGKREEAQHCRTALPEPGDPVSGLPGRVSG